MVEAFLAWLEKQTAPNGSRLARANGLNPLKYLEYLLKSRPSEDLFDEELDNLAPWNMN